jgi:hypothetical protein
MKSILFSLLTVAFLLEGTGKVFAQADTVKKYRIAVFLPLYLDSAYDESGNYRYDKNFPKFMSPGLEFYEGLQLAADSLDKENAPIDIEVYDTRSTRRSIDDFVHDSSFRSTALIIGHITPGEQRQLAGIAAQLQVPFINVNYPNDAGVTNNPEMVILNSTLQTHCEGIYKFIQRNYSFYNIIFIRKKGSQEDRLKNYFADFERTAITAPLRIKYLLVGDEVDMKELTPFLDSNLKTVCIIGSLDEHFARTVCARFASVNSSYHAKVFGMPTLDAITDFSSPAYADQEIYYTTPFYINPNDSLANSILQYFRDKFYMRPSDLVYRGYETTYRFSKLLEKAKGHFNGNIGERNFKVFNDFDIQPVFLDKKSMTLDYLENKKLYFIKKVNGNVVAVY